MTVFAKPLNICEKPVANSPPYVRGSSRNESRVEVPEEEYQGPMLDMTRGPTFIALSVILLFALGVASIVVMMKQYKYGMYNNYTAFCHIPVPRDFTEPDFSIDIIYINNGEIVCQRMSEGKYRALPITWSSKPMMQVVSTVEELESDDIMEMLNEELNIGGEVEKIAVVDNGRRVNFIHDFSDNITGIVDDERCFVMDLQPEMVMPPDLLLSGLISGEQFDVSKVRTHLRAALPALVDLANTAQKLSETCFARPTYRLYKDEEAIDKRSTDAQPHDYIQFSGKHVQEIKIDNIAEILKYEESIKKI